MRRGRRIGLGLGLGLAVLAADQGSKWWVLHGLDLPGRGLVELLPVLDLVMTWNHGVTFGMLNGGTAGPVLLGVAALAVVAGLGVWLYRAEGALVTASLGAIAGGALGNVIDRARYGAVVDFIHLHAGGWDPFPYVFNLGDSAICLGVAALFLDGLLPARRPPGADPGPGPGADRLAGA